MRSTRKTEPSSAGKQNPSTTKKKPLKVKVEIVVILLAVLGIVLTGITIGIRTHHHLMLRDIRTRFEQLHDRTEDQDTDTNRAEKQETDHAGAQGNELAFVSAAWPENGYTEDYIRECAASQVYGTDPSEVWLKKAFDQDGYVWHGTFSNAGTSYAFEIDALTGEFLKWEAQPDETSAAIGE